MYFIITKIGSNKVQKHVKIPENMMDYNELQVGCIVLEVWIIEYLERG